MKKFWIGAAVAAMLLTGCSTEDTPSPGNDRQDDSTVVGASLSTTRTTLDGTKIRWSAGDALAIYTDQVSTPQEYTIFEGVGESSARFRSTTAQGVSGNTFYAVYPNSLVDGRDRITLPSVQNYYAEENFSTDTFPMAAKSTDRTRLRFENLCGVLVVEIGADMPGVLVNSIDITSFAGQSLSGAATIGFSGAVPVLNCTGSKKLTLACNGVELPVNGKKAFYLVVPAGTYEQVRIEINAETIVGGISINKTRGSQFVVAPGEITRVGASFGFSTKTYSVGDLYPDAQQPEGVVYEVRDNGRSGKVLALNDCSVDGTEVDGDLGAFYTYLWGPASASAITAATGNALDGASNMEAVVSAGVSAYPAFAACRNLGNGWYIPASNEMMTLMDAYGSVEPIIVANGGSIMAGDGYWCSNTTGTRKNIYYYDAVDGVLMTVSPTRQQTVNNAVRAVMAF